MNSQEIKKYIIEVLKQGFPNKKTLDKLSTSDSGNLLFDGKEIKDGGSGSLSDLNIEEIFKANSADEMISEGETITLPKNYNEYDQIVLGIGTKGDGFDYGLNYFYLYPKTSNKINFAGYYQRWGTVTFENNICTLNYGRQAGEDSNRAFCIASLYGINFGRRGGSSSGVNYSTEEQKVGKWIDGKPIYQLTFSVDLTSSYTDVKIHDLPDNLDRFVNMYGFFSDSHTQVPINYDAGSSWFHIYTNKTGIYAWCLTTGNIYCTIQYTKTTD